MSKRILWLDNDSAYLYPFVEALEDEGYETKVVESLTDAERLLKSERYDLMIIDAMIPTIGVEEEKRYEPRQTDLGYKTGLLFYVLNKTSLEKAGTKVMVMTVRLDRAIMDEFIKAGLPKESYATKYEMSDPTRFLNTIQAALAQTEQASA